MGLWHRHALGAHRRGPPHWRGREVYGTRAGCSPGMVSPGLLGTSRNLCLRRRRMAPHLASRGPSEAARNAGSPGRGKAVYGPGHAKRRNQRNGLGGLRRRHIPAQTAMAALLVGLVSFYTAYLTAALLSLGILWLHHQVNPALLAVAAIFSVVAVAIPATVLWLRHWSARSMPR